MDAAETPSLRHRLLQGAATLLALAVLYVLGGGPMAYAVEKFPRIAPLAHLLYRPLGRAIRGSALEKPLDAYGLWWLRLAGWTPEGNPHPVPEIVE